jgi:hypothetical protein
VSEAERQLAGDATVAGRTLSDLRRERSGTYDRWLAEQAADAEMADRAGVAATRRAASGG